MASDKSSPLNSMAISNRIIAILCRISWKMMGRVFRLQKMKSERNYWISPKTKLSLKSWITPKLWWYPINKLKINLIPHKWISSLMKTMMSRRLRKGRRKTPLKLNNHNTSWSQILMPRRLPAKNLKPLHSQPRIIRSHMYRQTDTRIPTKSLKGYC